MTINVLFIPAWPAHNYATKGHKTSGVLDRASAHVFIALEYYSDRNQTYLNFKATFCNFFLPFIFFGTKT